MLRVKGKGLSVPPASTAQHRKPESSGGGTDLTGFRRRKNNNLLALAFALGVVCCLILPLWTWMLAVGALLIAAGFKILID
jgi:hypothetical protein